MNQPLWGIDLGGTKMEGVILKSEKDPEPLVRTRVDTESSGGYDHIIGQIEKLVVKMKAESGLTPKSIGFGTPGILDPISLTMKNCNTTMLNGQPLKKDLEARLQMPVMLANDANCFALAEANWGGVKKKAPGARMVFGIIMGTGGGGEILLTGKSGTAIMVSAGNGVIIFWMNREDRVIAEKADAWRKCCPALPCRNITKTSQAKKNPSRKSWPCSIRMPRPGKPSVALPIFLEKQFP